MSSLSPRLVMTLLVRDEEDIIDANLRFHLAQGVDFFIVMDHHSKDGTPAIVEKYQARGLAELIRQPDPGYRQAEWVTWMARRAATTHGADWVINNDADEFWWPSEGSLRSTLAAVPQQYGAVHAARLNFYPVAATRFGGLRARAKSLLKRLRPEISGQESAVRKPESNAAPSEFLETMTLCDLRSVNSLGLPLPGKVCHRAHPDAKVSMGNHAVEFPEGPRVCEGSRIEILHFPVRSAAQFCHKIAVGGAALALSPEVPGGETWRTLFDGSSGQSASRYYRATRMNSRKISRMLRDGRIQRDTRLRDFMRACEAEIVPVE